MFVAMQCGSIGNHLIEINNLMVIQYPLMILNVASVNLAALLVEIKLFLAPVLSLSWHCGTVSWASFSSTTDGPEQGFSRIAWVLLPSRRLAHEVYSGFCERSLLSPPPGTLLPSARRQSSVCFSL